MLAVRILAFARLREVLGWGEQRIELGAGATVEDAWNALAAAHPALAALRASTRFALNGSLTEAGAAVADGDEVALLPPVGGG